VKGGTVTWGMKGGLEQRADANKVVRHLKLLKVSTAKRGEKQIILLRRDTTKARHFKRHGKKVGEECKGRGKSNQPSTLTLLVRGRRELTR